MSCGMWAHVLQQDGAGTVRKDILSLPKVILVLLSRYVVSSSLYKPQVLGSSDLGQGEPHNMLGFWRWNSKAQQWSSHSNCDWCRLYSWRAA